MEYWRNSPGKRWYKNIKLYTLIRLYFFFEGEYCHLCQRRKHFYAKVNITILKFELIHLVESLQEVTDSNILLLNFDMSIILGQNSYYFFYEFEKALIYFLCFGSWNVFLNVRNPFYCTICHLVFLTHWAWKYLECADFWFPNYVLPRREVGIWNSATDLGKFQIQNKTFISKLCSKVERDFFMSNLRSFPIAGLSENYYSLL